MRRSLEIAFALIFKSALIGGFSATLSAVDTDNDGIDDDFDLFPNDPLEWSDFDRDGVGNNSDTLQEFNDGAEYEFSEGHENPFWYSFRVNNATLNISGGILEGQTLDNVWDTWVGGNAAGQRGVVNMSGGDVTMNFIEIARGAGSEGAFYQSGGALKLPSESRKNPYNFFIGGNDGGTGGIGMYEIRGGSIATRGGVEIISAGSVFSVVGSGPESIALGSIDLENTHPGTRDDMNYDGAWLQQPGAILQLAIDQGGLTPIILDGPSSGARFEEGALLDLSFTGDAIEGSWVAMQWVGGLEDLGLSVVADDAIEGWSFSFEDRDSAVVGDDTLIVSFEPFDPADHLIKDAEESLKIEFSFSDPFRFTIDTIDGPRSIPGDVIFAEGSILDISLNRGEVEEGSWIVFQWEGSLNDNGLQLSADDVAAGWSFSYEDNGISENGLDTLILTYKTPIDVSLGRTFQHPGLVHKRSDLDRAKYNIEAGLEPWASSFAELAANPFSSYDYDVAGDPSWELLNRENPRIRGNEFQSDFEAAYQNSLMWYFTGDQRHADKAIEILNTWSNLKYVTGIPLGAGIYGHQMLQSAEIIRNTNAGWKEEDIKKFEAMLLYPGYSNEQAPVTDLANDRVSFYWKCYVGDSSRAGNQDASCYLTLMAIGVFLDNAIIYERGLRYFRDQPHNDFDLPYPSGPHISTTVSLETPYQISWNFVKDDSIEDYGFDGVLTNYIIPSGQTQETSRDQSHTFLGISFLTRAAEIAWNQGDDLYGWADDRLLSGYEYNGRYNASFLRSYEDQPEPWEPSVESGEFEQIESRTGRTTSLAPNPWVGADLTRPSRGNSAFIGRPFFEMPLSHYKYRTNLDEEDYKWLQRIVDISIEEKGGFEGMSATTLDATGFGAMSHRRGVGMAGDPVGEFNGNVPEFNIPFIPGIVEAENFDFYIQEAGGGEGITYHDSDDTNTGGEYRIEEAVDIEVCSEGGFNLTNMENGEWITYTVHVPVSGDYNISVRYASVSGEGSIRFAFAGSDVTGDESLPATGSETNWSTHTVAENVSIEKGVQAMRLFVSGDSNAYLLNSMILELVTSDLTTRFQAEDFGTGRGVSIGESTDEGGGSIIESAQSGSWSQYDSIFLGTASKMKFRVARPEGTPSGRIDIRLGDQGGEIVGSVEVPVTGGWDQWATIETVIGSADGANNVFLVYEQNDNSARAPLFNFNWFELGFLDTAKGLKVEALEGDQATISWEPAKGATGYSLKRSNLSGGPYDEIGFLSSTERSFLDTNVEEGTQYFYIVNSIYNDTEGVASEELIVIPSKAVNLEEASLYVMRRVENNSLAILIPNTEIGHVYTLQKTSSLEEPVWEYVGEALEGTGGELEIELPIDSFDPSMYYQLEVSR
ncbi:carbohydrate-binding protein [Puniceicoccaceae bacterium K14]|nr:carbohydrate-binding protein [Puniceicoccaceae bacterium K14]